MTAILATIGAMFGYEGGATQNDAAMFKNEAAIKKTVRGGQINSSRLSRLSVIPDLGLGTVG